MVRGSGQAVGDAKRSEIIGGELSGSKGNVGHVRMWALREAQQEDTSFPWSWAHRSLITLLLWLGFDILSSDYSSLTIVSCVAGQFREAQLYEKCTSFIIYIYSVQVSRNYFYLFSLTKCTLYRYIDSCSWAPCRFECRPVLIIILFIDFWSCLSSLMTGFIFRVLKGLLYFLFYRFFLSYPFSCSPQQNTTRSFHPPICSWNSWLENKSLLVFLLFRSVREQISYKKG